MRASSIIGGTVLVIVVLALVVPALLLAFGVLPYKVYVIHTGSMSPTIPSKSAVIVHEGSYRLGQVITFQTADGPVTHRLIERRADATLATKGDANRTADPSSLQPANVIGGVVAAPRMLGFWIVYLRNPAGITSVFLTIICAWLLYSLPADFARRKRQPKTRSGHVPMVRPAPRPTVRSVPGTPTAAARTGAQEGDAVILQCSHCGATFRTGDALRAHRAIYPRRAGSSSRKWPAKHARHAAHAPRSLGEETP